MFSFYFSGFRHDARDVAFSIDLAVTPGGFFGTTNPMESFGSVVEREWRSKVSGLVPGTTLSILVRRGVPPRDFFDG
jgi:hypothetical protein